MAIEDKKEHVPGNSYRWVVLTVFTLVAGLSQLLWLNFAPLLLMIQKQYNVSEFMASLLLLVFPLIYSCAYGKEVVKQDSGQYSCCIFHLTLPTFLCWHFTTSLVFKHQQLIMALLNSSTFLILLQN